jgi:hypothetical protein
MERAVRHPDGTFITASEWDAIKASARLVKADLLSLPPPRHWCAKERSKTKTFFRTYFRTEWEAALARLESLQPLLALCASHWKADHVLGNTLRVKVVNASEDDASDDSDELPKKSLKKRSGRGRSGGRKRHKKCGDESESSGKVAEPGKEVDKGKLDAMDGDIYYSTTKSITTSADRFV